MTDRIVEKKREHAYFLLIFASFFMYIILTGAKTLYTAEKTTLSELGSFGNLTDLATTMEYYFYTYALMQLVLVFFMKRMNIKWFLTVTLGISAVITCAVAFTDTIEQHYVLYAVNGLMQAGIWGCSLKVLSDSLPMRLLPLANKIMTAGPALAGAVSYATAAMFGDDWSTPFLVLGIILIFAVALYFFSVTYLSRFPKEKEEIHIVRSDGTEEDIYPEDENDFIHLTSRCRVAVFYAVSLVMGFAVTSIFFILNSNLDMFLKEVGGFDNDIAKLLTVLAPISIVLGPILTVNSCEKHKNFLLVAAAYFGLASIFALLLILLFESHVVISLGLILVFLILVNGGRSVSLSIAALRMRRKIDAGVYSTLVNAIASVASGISPKIITRLLDNPSLTVSESWRASFIIIFAACVAVVILILLIALWVKLANRRLEEKADIVKSAS